MRKIVFASAILLLAGTMFAQQGSAAHALPAGLPPLGPLHIVSMPKVKQYRLANGMQVWLVSRPDLPKVELNLLLKGGDSLDPASAPGLAQILATAVTQGTATKSAKEIADTAQFVGGEISSSADADSTQLGIDALSEYADRALVLLADLAQNANFPANRVAFVRSHLTNQLLARQGDPHFLARRDLFAVFYPDHPYSIVAPPASTVRNATPASLLELYRQAFSPNRALLVVVGDFQQRALLKDIKANFGSWKNSGAAVASTQAPAVKPDHRVYIVSRPHSVQTTMLIAAPAPTLHDADGPILELADAIYGSGFNSRLRRNIREDKGYSYHPGSQVETRRWCAIVQTHEDVRNAVTGPSLKQTFYELDRMAAQPPTGEELLNGKRYVIGNTALAIHSRQGLADVFGSYWVQDVPPSFLQNELNKVRRATTAEVRQISAKYLASARMTVVAVGDERTIRDQLRSFNMPILDAPPPTR